MAIAGGRARKRRPKWAHVKDVFAVGSTSAAYLCRRFGFDPDDQTGGCAECKGDFSEDINGDAVCDCGNVLSD